MASSKGGKNGNDDIFFPSNVVPAKKAAQEQWKRDWVEAMRRYSYLCFSPEDSENFRYAQGRVFETEFNHVTQLYFQPNSKKVLPSKIRQVNAISHILNRIIGKVDAMDLKFSATAINEDAVNAKLDKLATDVTERITRHTRQQAGVAELVGQPMEEGDDVPESIDDILGINPTNFHEENEINVSLGLKYLLTKKRGHLKYKLNHQVFYNYLCTRKMAFDNYVQNGDPDGRSIDPRYLIYDLESGSPFIQDGRFCGYYFPCTPQQIIDMCPEMSSTDLDKLDAMSKLFANGRLTGVTSAYWYADTDTNMYFLNCWKMYWKAVKWTKCVIEENPLDKDNPYIFYVDDKTEPDLRKGQKVEYRPINTWFECIRVGEDIFYQPREIPNQQRPMDEPSEAKAPIDGIIDNLPCVVELLKPLQALRIECFYSLERLIGQAKGKVLIVDEATEEDGQDNLYNMMAFNVYKVNSAKEGDQQLGVNNFMQPKEIDMGLSTAVNDLMRFVAFLDQQMALITGINEPAQGIIKSDTGLGVMQAAQESAQLTLEPYYNVFYTVAEQILQSQCNLMKQAWGGRKKIGYILGDHAKTFFSLDPTKDWQLDDYGIFIENGVSSQKQKELVLKMASQLLPIAKEPKMALSIIKMFNAASGAEAEQIFEKGIDAIEIMNKQAQAFEAAEAEKRDKAVVQVAGLKAQTEDAKNKTAETVATIQAQATKEVAGMKIAHQEDAEVVKYQNKVAEETAKGIIEKELIEHQARVAPKKEESKK